MANLAKIYTLKAKSPWARRIFDLLGALGLNIKEGGQLLGFCDGRSLSRILYGGKPTVQFLLTLEKLEAAYAGEIQRFIAENRQYKRNRERTLLARGRSTPARPEDIAEMGVVAPVGQVSAAQRRKDKKDAHAKALDIARKRRFNAKNSKAKARRSKTFRRRLYNLAYGTKRISGQRVKDEFQKKEEANGTGCQNGS